MNETLTRAEHLLPVEHGLRLLEYQVDPYFLSCLLDHQYSSMTHLLPWPLNFSLKPTYSARLSYPRIAVVRNKCY